MMRGSARNGFSLIEILTSIALLAVLTTIAISILFKVTDGWRITTLRGNLFDTSENIMASLRQDMGNVLSQKLSGVSVRGEQRSSQSEDPASPFFKMAVEDDRLILPLQHEELDQGQKMPISVMYEVDRSVEPPELVRVLGPLRANPPDGARTIVGKGVRGLRFEFFDGKTWAPAWDQPALPQAVRASVTLADATQPEQQVARAATFTIHVD